MDAKTRVELYKAVFATPENVPDMRLWLQKELDRIQRSFATVDELIQDLEAVGPGEGDPGPPGAPGLAGADGRGVHTFFQSNEPGSDVSAPGDVWFVKGYE